MSSTLLAEAAVSRIGARLSTTQVDVADLRNRIGHLALVATFDPDRQNELIEARTRLAESETQMRELGAAEQLAQTMARDAKQKILLARRSADWSTAADVLHAAEQLAGELDGLVRQVGDLYGQLRTKLNHALALTGPHMLRDDHKLLIAVPDLTEMLKLTLANAGGPSVDPFSLPHLDAAGRAQASIAAVVQQHGQRVLNFRPADTAEENSSHD